MKELTLLQLSSDSRFGRGLSDDARIKLTMRDADAQHALVASLQTDYLADDLDPPTDAAAWSEARVAAWFEAGGCEPDYPQMVESEVSIPRDGKEPLNGKILLPSATAECKAGLVWASANPGKRFGAEHMDSAVPAAIAAECARVGLPLLRFDYAGVRGSGSSSEYQSDQPYHPTASDDVAAAVRHFRRSTGCIALAVGGHSMGANAIMPCCRDGELAAIISCGTGPLVYKFMPLAVRESVAANQRQEHSALPMDTPKLFVVGEEDKMSTRDAMEALLSVVPPPHQLELVSRATHNLEGHEQDAAERIVAFVRAAVGAMGTPK
jgi:predicted alpha/beta hydrolase